MTPYQIFIFVTMSIVIILLGLALYLFFSAALHLPSKKTIKNLAYLSKKTINKPSMIDNISRTISSKIAKKIPMDALKESKIQDELTTLGLKLTPKEYYANALTKALIFAVFMVPFLIIQQTWSYVIAAFIGIGAIIIYLLEYNQIAGIIRKRQEQIDRELPRFVSVVQQTLKQNHDVTGIITDYISGDETPLTTELKLALADMKTGDYEVALTRLSRRVNSLFLSETVRGLISTTHGDDTSSYFETLDVKIWSNERLRIKKEAMKSPGKIKFVVAANLGCMILIYIAVFGQVIMGSMGSMGMFGH